MKRVNCGELKNTLLLGLYETRPEISRTKSQLATPQPAHATTTSNHDSLAKPINNPAMTSMKKVSKGAPPVSAIIAVGRTSFQVGGSRLARYCVSELSSFIAAKCSSVGFFQSALRQFDDLFSN
jgi:hypothetical protein